MFKIGEFAALTGISIYMLRNYDKIGLLRPEHVDEWSGYRYYNERQIVEAGRIQVLKSLGFGLKDICSIQAEKLTGTAMEDFLKGRIKEKETEIEQSRHQLKRMKRALRDLDRQDQCALSVHVKKIPAHHVVSLREWIRDFPEEGILWQRLNQACRDLRIKLSDVRYSFAITHEIDLKQQRIDTEVRLVVDETRKDLNNLTFLAMPEMEVAVVAYRGVYDKIGDINRYIVQWVEENDYEVCGKNFQAYYVSPGNHEIPENFITEVCFPVRKK